MDAHFDVPSPSPEDAAAWRLLFREEEPRPVIDEWSADAPPHTHAPGGALSMDGALPGGAHRLRIARPPINRSA